MLLLVYGPDTYRAREKVHAIRAQYEERYLDARQFHILDWAAEPNLDTVRELVETTGFFAAQKLVVIRDLFAAPAATLEKLQHYLKDSAVKKQKETTLLIWDRPLETAKRKADDAKTEKTKLLTAWLKRNALCEEFALLKGKEFMEWAKKELGSRAIALPPDTLQRFCRAFEGDTWRAVMEMEKLSLGHPFIPPVSEKAEVFDLVRALWRKDARGALATLETLLAAGVNEFYILAMMAYSVRKSLERARGAQLETLKNAFERIARTDINIKTGVMEPDLALELLTLQLLRA
ncbi:MAG: hypothetical protein Q8R13_00815 [bacterium]|nr:hypothetical protein [bacterium]MDZ4296615.1 hypothetical protein [Patescibacteria group bacterium]